MLDRRTSEALKAFAEFTAGTTSLVKVPPRHRSTRRASRPVYPVWPTSPAELAALFDRA